MIHLGDNVTLPVLSVRSVSGSDGASWASHDVIEAKPLLQWTGPTTGTLSISLYFHVAFADPEAALVALRALKNAGAPFMVWIENGLPWGTYVLKDIQSRPQWTLPTGEVLAMTIDISLDEPGDVDVVEATKPPGLAAYAIPESVAALLEDTSRDPSTVTPEEIVRQ